MDNYDKHDIAVAYAQAMLYGKVALTPGLADDDPPKQYESLCAFVKAYRFAMKNLEESFRSTED